MPWVQYDESGQICGVCANQQKGLFASEAFKPDDDPEIFAFLYPAAPVTILPQALMAQFTPADMSEIMRVVNADTTGAVQLLWFSMVAQRDPMLVENERVMAGWDQLVAVLGQPRMNEIATALGIMSLVAST